MANLFLAIDSGKYDGVLIVMIIIVLAILALCDARDELSRELRRNRWC